MSDMAALRADLGETGWVTFTAAPGGVNVAVHNVYVAGMSDGLHGFHVHALGSSPGDCASAGPHYNPRGATRHGGLTDPVRHLGDLGNLRSMNGWIQETRLFAPGLTLPELQGRSVVLHAHEDDLGHGGTAASHASGNSGPRVACGRIGTLGSVS